MLAAVSWLAGCAGPRPVPLEPAPQAPPARVAERWVDAHARHPEGDGTFDRPLRTLGLALAALPPEGGRIHVRTGLYRGPFLLPEGVWVRGHGEVVLHAEGDAEAVVTLAGAGGLQALHVQGGLRGVRIQAGPVRLEGVKLSGQRTEGVEVRDGGVLEATAVDVEGTVSGTLGVRVGPGGRAVLHQALFRGGLSEGLRVEAGGFARLVDARSEGPAQALRSIGGSLEVEGLRAAGGRMAAVGVGGGTARLSQVVVVGHEYALLVGAEAKVSVRGLTSLRAERAGVGVAASTVEMEEVLVLGAGSHGGINAVGATLTLRRFLVSGAGAYGISLHGGEADVSHGAIVAVTDDGGGGDGVHARIGKARLSHLHLSRLEGVGVQAAQGAVLTLRDLSVDRAAWAGVLAETGGSIDAVSVSVRRSGGSAVAVPGEGRIFVDALVAEQNAAGTVWVECGQGAEVWLGRVRAPDLPAIQSPCVGRGRPAAPGR
jgi:hypothetical protein